MQDSESLSRIIRQCQKSNHKAYEELLDLYGNRCFGYFYRLTSNEELSNELLGELFLKLVTKIKYYKTGSFDLWLFKIASNIFYDYLRLQQRQKIFIEKKRQSVQEFDTKEIAAFDTEAVDVLQSKLQQLDDSTREIVMLRFYSQLSFKEIAELKNEPIGTVLSKVHRGLAKLRQMMESKYGI